MFWIERKIELTIQHLVCQLISWICFISSKNDLQLQPLHSTILSCFPTVPGCCGRSPPMEWHCHNKVASFLNSIKPTFLKYCLSLVGSLTIQNFTFSKHPRFPFPAPNRYGQGASQQDTIWIDSNQLRALVGFDRRCLAGDFFKQWSPRSK